MSLTKRDCENVCRGYAEKVREGENEMKDRFLIVMEVEADINLTEERKEWGSEPPRSVLIDGVRGTILYDLKKGADCDNYVIKIRRMKIHDPPFFLRALPNFKRVKYLWNRIFGVK